MSVQAVNVIEISEVRPHENAERLEIVPVSGWQAVVRKGEFKAGDRAIYIEPDYTVPTARPEFAFLAREGRDRHRLRAVRLRGVLSFGLLIPLPAELASEPVGASVMEALGIERYAPPVRFAQADELPEDQWPRVWTPVFDIESYQKFPTVLQPGEEVIVTEKIHGANARYVFVDGVFYMGSRTRWLRPDVDHAWKRAADNDPMIRVWCEAFPGAVLYGEVFGRVQSLKYGIPNDVAFAGFAALSGSGWWELTRLRWSLVNRRLRPAPFLYEGPFDPNIVLPLAEQDSSVGGAPAGHVMEGIVIVPRKERRDDRIGRVALKHISSRYWTGDAE